MLTESAAAATYTLHGQPQLLQEEIAGNDTFTNIQYKTRH